MKLTSYSSNAIRFRHKHTSNGKNEDEQGRSKNKMKMVNAISTKETKQIDM